LILILIWSRLSGLMMNRFETMMNRPVLKWSGSDLFRWRLINIRR
jgi:hypothetical protein